MAKKLSIVEKAKAAERKRPRTPWHHKLNSEQLGDLQLLVDAYKSGELKNMSAIREVFAEATGIEVKRTAFNETFQALVQNCQEGKG